jgi:hypothetical protein
VFCVFFYSCVRVSKFLFDVGDFLSDANKRTYASDGQLSCLCIKVESGNRVLVYKVVSMKHECTPYLLEGIV